MNTELPLESFAPPFDPDLYPPTEHYRIAPFFSNLNRSVYAPMIFSPEIIGALCSRTSRATGDLRTVFLQEYIIPFLEPRRLNKDSVETWQAKQDYQIDLTSFIEFLHQHPLERIFSNPRARSFYAKWLAQYGDDSIAQMAGMHLVFASLSQVAIKHFEDQRIGLAPIEKSTRYVDYSSKVNGQYRYYTDPTLGLLGLEKQYRAAMDGLFETYTSLLPRLINWLTIEFPQEKQSVIEKKAFDTLRGLLPTSTLSQVAFFGNGQAYEYLVSRSLGHGLGEVRWAAEQAYRELYTIAPSFLRRIKDVQNQNQVQSYQNYLSGKGQRMAQVAEARLPELLRVPSTQPTVELVEYDKEGEVKVMTGMLYQAANMQGSWRDIWHRVRAMTLEERRQVIDVYFAGRKERWQKVGRALENAFVRFEIVMNIGSWRDIHRHRMLTQQRQLFTCAHGYDLPPEIQQAGLETEFRAAIEQVEPVQVAIAQHNPELAQYAVTMAHRLRFMQWQNLRECFWEMELRTIPEGHPDYRHIEQAKFRLLQRVYPVLTEYMRVNLGEYDFARRGQDDKIQAKLRELTTSS